MDAISSPIFPEYAGQVPADPVYPTPFYDQGSTPEPLIFTARTRKRAALQYRAILRPPATIAQHAGAWGWQL
ncbi:hypothetical protein MB02_01940 [Croceicoccus estronivorus]|nr:hypothetical protein MB02_01940 [Croceicoccus estronivorus]